MSREKQIDIITDLLIDFDEMGFIPGTLCPDPEAYAIDWRNKLTKALEDYRKQSEGEWVKVPRIISYTDDNVEVRTMCSHCGAEFVEHIPCDTYDYCPICGAKMKGGAE